MIKVSYQKQVLAKAALRGRIDWLKGLKKCCSGDPVGTGFKGILLSSLEKKEEYIRGGNERDFVPPQKRFSHPSLIYNFFLSNPLFNRTKR